MFDALKKNSLPRMTLTGINRTIKRAWRFNRLLTAAVIAMILLMPLPFFGMILDPKILTGVNGWIKPLKFLISGAVYGATFLWLLTYVSDRRRAVQIAANVTGAVLLAEILLITIQVMRGRTSHFNTTTALDAAIFSFMGAAITLLAVMCLLLALLLMVQRTGNPVFNWALRLGVIASFVGMTTAYLMTAGPTPDQLAAMKAGQTPTAIGAHSVGVQDGGPGLPFLGWSTQGGDLRVGHFVGLHGLQVIPLLGWLLVLPASRRRWARSQRLVLVWIGGLTYIGWTMLLTWQALRGQSVIAPDADTWMAYGLLVGLALTATGLVVLQRPVESAPRAEVANSAA